MFANGRRQLVEQHAKRSVGPAPTGHHSQELGTNAVGLPGTIPELTAADFARAMPNPYYLPVKKSINARLDADVIAWLRSKGKGYQTRMNQLLRQAMLQQIQPHSRPRFKKRA